LRLRRLLEVIQIVMQLMDSQVARVLELVRAMMRQIPDETFDFEAACNLMTLLSLMAQRAIQIDEVEQNVATLGRRFCTSNALTELLAQAASAHPPYSDKLRDMHGEIVHLIEHAMRQSLAGNPRGAVVELLAQGEKTQNAKVIESAWGVLKRYEERIDNAAALATDIEALRARYQTVSNKPAIGDKSLRQSGGVSLRVMDMPATDATKP
jgi:hypothetical protein